MNDFKITIKLKQHTPIIHFQHEQHGATLRATELKPKLDRFLIEKQGGVRNLRNKHPNWFNSKDHSSLDCKMKITTNQPIDVKMEVKCKKGRYETNFPTFFANMGKESKNDLVNFTKYENITVELFSLNIKLIAFIKFHFNEFILTTNFGTRQSKGFGSFYIDDVKSVKDIEASYPYLSVNKGEIKDHSDLFHIINYYFQRLKSGVNFRDHYRHSFLKLYLSGKGINWEKRWLKEQFIKLKGNSDDKVFARAMLGLVGSYSFIKPKIKREGQVYPYQKTTITVESATNIARFQSPITFKPIEFNEEWRIYVIPTDIPKEMADMEFSFTANGKTSRLKTPKDIIDVSDLIKEYHKHLGDSFKAYTFSKHFNSVKINNK